MIKNYVHDSKRKVQVLYNHTKCLGSPVEIENAKGLALLEKWTKLDLYSFCLSIYKQVLQLMHT